MKVMNRKINEKFLCRILEHLKASETTTVAQVAQKMGLTSIEDVRKGLKVLCNEGTVIATLGPTSSGRWQAQYYRLAESAPESADRLSERILDVLEDGAASVYELRAELGGNGRPILEELRRLVEAGLVERNEYYGGRMREVHVARYSLARTKPIVGSLRKAA